MSTLACAFEVGVVVSELESALALLNYFDTGCWATDCTCYFGKYDDWES